MSGGPLIALKRMVTIPRKLNMDHLKVYLTSESGKKNGTKLNKRIRWGQEEMKEVSWCYMYEKLKENFGSRTRKTFDRFTTKDSYTWNITHNTESTAV
jgi:hypothetical protein